MQVRKTLKRSFLLQSKQFLSICFVVHFIFHVIMSQFPSLWRLTFLLLFFSYGILGAFFVNGSFLYSTQSLQKFRGPTVKILMSFRQLFAMRLWYQYIIHFCQSLTVRCQLETKRCTLSIKDYVFESLVIKAIYSLPLMLLLRPCYCFLCNKYTKSKLLFCLNLISLTLFLLA